MAVLTSPRRTRPRFGLGAGLVAATRGIAFAGLMLAGLGLLVVIAAAAFFTALGAGVLIVGNGGPRDQRVLLALRRARHRARPWPVRRAARAAGHPRAGPPDQAAGRGLVRRAHSRAVRARARREAHLPRTAQVAGDGPGHVAGPAVDGGEPGRLRGGRAVRRHHRDRPDRVHRARADPGDPAARVSGQHRGDADRAGSRDRLGRGAGGPGAAARLRPAGPLDAGAGRGSRAGGCGCGS